MRVGVVATALAASVLAGCGVPGSPLASAVQPTTGGDELGLLSQGIPRIRPDLPGGKAPRQAMLFSYVAMDDGLTAFADRFLGAIERSATDRVYNVAFADFQGPDNSYMFDLGPGRPPAKSFLMPDRKEVTSNDPRTFASTLNWAFSNYSGEFKALDLFAHGGGAIGFGTDETQLKGDKKYIMSVADVGNALRLGLKGRRVNLVNMLSCLMGNIEYAYELKDVADVLIASQDSIFATSDTTVDFTAELNRLLAEPNPDARRIGRKLGMFADAKNPNSGYATISAVDLTKMTDVASAINKLSNTLLAAMPRHKAEILDAYDSVPHLQHADWLGFNRDLWTFCTLLNRKVENKAVKEAAVAARAALKDALVYTRDREGAAANGLSIAMPDRHGEMAKIWNLPAFQTRLQCKFEKRATWDKFLDAVRQAS